MTRQALTPQAPIERLADAVVHGFSRPAEVELHAIPVRPVIQLCRGKFRPVVALNNRGEAAARSPASLSTWPSRSAPRLREELK